LGGWLTTVVARVCLDVLRSRKARREQFVGVRMPTPIEERPGGVEPEREALVADAVGPALLVVLETLTPAERLACVLPAPFDLPFDQIAALLERSPAAARHLASRARRRVRGVPGTPHGDPARHREAVEAFVAAARDGDFGALLAVLDPDVVFR